MFETFLTQLQGPVLSLWGPFVIILLCGFGIPIPEDIVLLVAGALAAVEGRSWEGVSVLMYLAVIGGAAALETTWITAIEDVDMDDLNPESLWRFAIQDFGPLIVGMDSHGGSLYRDVQASVEARRAAVLAKLGAA